MRYPPPFLSILSFTLVTVTVLVTARWAIPTLEHPIWQPGDWGSFPFASFLFEKTVSWFPVPHFAPSTDWYFYPYGTDSLYLNWGFERDLFFNMLNSLVGEGPWLPLYFILSLFITGWGLLWILMQVVPIMRAGFIASLVVGFNFYVYAKLPGHFNICIVHWTLLGIAADHAITRIVWRGEALPPALTAFRLFITVSTLGLELGYVAGYGLLSLVLHLPFIGFALHRRAEWSWQPRNLLAGMAHSFRKGGWGTAGVLLLAAVTAWLYVPLVLQIKLRADQFAFPFFEGGYLWIQPLLGLSPYLPGGEALRQSLLEALGGMPETPFDWRPGWTLLLLAGWGLWHARKRLAPLMPLLLLLILCAVYHPFLMPTLKLFPWHAFNRVNARATLILPTVLLLLALAIPWKELLRGGILRRVVMGGILLSVVAMGVAEIRAGHPPRGPLNVTDPDFFRYLEAVSRYPGEAILDWPFCIIGGNGFLTDQDLLCPDYGKLAPIGFLAHHHGKKVMGQYLGRLHHTQTLPFLRAGWDRLIQAVLEKRCFTPEEWDFFEAFFTRGDFAGINLYQDFISPSCIEEFIRRFGPPAHTAQIPVTGPVVFIPKQDRLRVLTDPEMTKRLQHIVPLKQDRLDLVRETPPRGVSVAGLDPSLSSAPGGRSYRASLDLTRQAEITVRFGMDGPHRGRLRLAGINRVPEQTLNILLNGQRIGERIGPIQAGDPFDHTMVLEAKAGGNELAIRFRRTLWLGDAFMKVWREQGWWGLLQFDSHVSAYRQTQARAIEFHVLELTGFK